VGQIAEHFDEQAIVRRPIFAGNLADPRDHRPRCEPGRQLDGGLGGFDPRLEVGRGAEPAPRAKADGADPQPQIVQCFAELAEAGLGEISGGEIPASVEFHGVGPQPGRRRQRLPGGEPQAGKFNPDLQVRHAVLLPLF